MPCTVPQYSALPVCRSLNCTSQVASRRNPSRRTISFISRKQALTAIYNASSMPADRQKQVEGELVRAALDDILTRSYASFAAAKADLGELYNASSMSAADRDHPGT